MYHLKKYLHDLVEYLSVMAAAMTGLKFRPI
jgi:hypothetical protein